MTKPNDPTKYEPTIELGPPAAVTIKLGVDAGPALVEIREAISDAERVMRGEPTNWLAKAVALERENCAKIAEAADPDENAAVLFIERVYANPGKPATDYVPRIFLALAANFFPRWLTTEPYSVTVIALDIADGAIRNDRPQTDFMDLHRLGSYLSSGAVLSVLQLQVPIGHSFQRLRERRYPHGYVPLVALADGAHDCHASRSHFALLIDHCCHVRVHVHRSYRLSFFAGILRRRRPSPAVYLCASAWLISTS